ncbi:MAG: hypothetical protein KIT80_04890 [Chitinophagaceae bacterium]|nr:hypothetical protein [Chitinophagaceae bacterium]MCW5926229.1 hypothetical protein [Chitinophagaceae bacterium]
MIRNAHTDEMTTLSGCINKLIQEGYRDELKPMDNGMTLVSSGKLYKPEDVKITNFYRFEGASNPDDNAILYAIEANDGIKATITDAYGAYADERIGKFIVAVEEIEKKTAS